MSDHVALSSSVSKAELLLLLTKERNACSNAIALMSTVYLA